MELTLDDWLRIGTFVVLIGSTATNVVVFLLARNDKRFSELQQSIEELAEEGAREDAARLAAHNELSKRIAVIEEWRKHVPTDEDISDIRREMAIQGHQIASIAERSVTTLQAVQRIEEYLLRRGNA